MSLSYAVEARNLAKHVISNAQSLTILSHLNLAVKAGDQLAIVGRSGSGKSTLLGLLAGLDLPSEGEVLVNGNNINTLDEDGRAEIRAKHMGFVFQSFQLMSALNALENVMLPLQLTAKAHAEKIAREALAKVGLSERLLHYPKQLSGGEQQRVAIARAFATQPRILFADEPTGNLDLETGQHIIDLLFSLNADAGTTLILVTHDTELAKRCHRSVTLQNGQLLEGQV